jgi:hypothetical protein
MNKKKIKRVTLLALTMGTCFAAGVCAQDGLQQVEAFLRPDFNVVVDGKPVLLEHPPLIYNDSSYLPLKELASYLNANVNWKGDTKTIYVNSRLYPDQATTNGDLTYEEFTMTNPYAYYVEYLGGTYPLLTDYGMKNYYRLSDVQKMGIDTSGLKKVKEKYTKWLFVSEDELKTKWKQKPAMSYTQMNDYGIVTQETDPVKLKTLQDYVKSWSSYSIDNQYHFITPVIMDVLPEKNKYRYLAIENRHFYFMYLQLNELTEGNYIVNTSSKEDIQAIP